MKQNLKKYLNIWLLLFMSFPCVAKDSKAGMVLHPVDKEYVTPILYDLKYAKEPKMCQVLLDVVNKDIRKSLFVDYSNTKYFVPWQLAEGAENHWSLYSAPKAWKQWLLKYFPPRAYINVDIDNDGHREHLYVNAFFHHGHFQSFDVLKNKPLEDWPIIDSPDKQVSLNTEFYLRQKKIGNVDLHLRWLIGLKNLDEELGLENTNSNYFHFDKNYHFVFKYHNKNYLIAERTNYDPNGSKIYDGNPFFLLLSVLPSDNVEIECVLKRQK